MTQTSNLMGLGTPAGQAKAIVGGSTIGLTSTGSGQTDGYAINGTNNTFQTVAAGTGAFLPSVAQTGDYYKVYNLGANALLVYPPSGAAINNGSTNAGFSIAAGKNAMFTMLSPTLWGANLSA